MNLEKHFKLLITILIFLLTLICFGCVDEESSLKSSSNDSSTNTASVTFSVSFPKDSSLDVTETPSIALSGLGLFSDVETVKVKVEKTSDSSEIVPERDLSETSPGVWALTLPNLPTDVQLDFIAKAYDGTPQAIFTDTKTMTLTGGGNNDLAFQMKSIDDGSEPDNPAIVSATIPNEIEKNSTGNTIAFTIDHTGSVEYTVAVSNGTITSASSGTHDPTTDLEVTYDAPADVGEDRITLRIKASNSPDYVGAAYPINVVDVLSSSNISVVFGPVATGMNFLRTATTLELEVQTDPTTDISYSWSGTGSFSDVSGDINPIIIDPFLNTDTGTQTVTITDGNGIQASLTRTIAEGDFNYTANAKFDIEFNIGDHAINPKIFYSIWIEENSVDPNRYKQLIFRCEDRPGLSPSSRYLPFWKASTGNDQGTFANNDIDALTGATINSDHSLYDIQLLDLSIRQFTVYFEIDVPDLDVSTLQNGNDWFVGQPAILYAADINLDTMTAGTYDFSAIGWTPEDDSSRMQNIPVSGAIIDNWEVGKLNEEMRYITHHRDSSSDFGEAYMDNTPNTNLVDSIKMHLTLQ